MRETEPSDDEVRLLAVAASRTEESGSRREGDRAQPLGTKARRTRNQLLQAAYAQFSETGYRDTKVADICARAGTSVGTFYQYFRSRADVMTSLVSESVRNTLDAPPWRLDGGRQGIRSLLGDYIAGYQATSAFQGVWEEATHVDDDPASVRRDLSRFMTDAIEREFAQAKRDGAFARDIDPGLLARALSAMVDRYCYLTFVFDPPAEPLPIEQSVDVLEYVWSATLGLPFEDGPSKRRTRLRRAT
jgi:AcrR family transcriptional regulator